VPVAIRDPRWPADLVDRFDEESVISGSLGLLTGTGFIEAVMGEKKETGR